MLAAACVCAQTAEFYPGRPLRLVVPFFPGGSPDLQGRLLAERLRLRLGQAVVVDNRPGANGTIGMGIVARAPADGHTLIVSPVGPWVVNAYLYKLPYDLRSDLSPVIQVSSVPAILAVHPAVPAQSVKDLIALARQKPGELNYTSTGIGVPARTSPAIIERLNREIGAILQTADMKEAARAEAYTIVGGPPAQFAAYLRSEHAKFAKLVKEAGITSGE